jgi:biotin transport system ATP-binding protein
VEGLSVHGAAVSVRGVGKVFPETGVVLDDVSFAIARGQCAVVAGANGSGKTVLMKIIAGLLPPDRGEVVFAAGFSHASVGLVFQDADSQIIGETVAEDIAVGPRNMGLRKAEVEERVGAALAASGLEAKAAVSPRALSGGEKRRLAIAGVLAMRRGIIIFDEPFANLDYPGVVSTLALIAALKRDGNTVVVLTHELEKVLALADLLVALVKGRLAASGPPVEILDALQSRWGIRDPRVPWVRPIIGRGVGRAGDQAAADGSWV